MAPPKLFSFLLIAVAVASAVSADWPCLFHAGGETTAREMLATHYGGAVLVGSRGPDAGWMNVTHIAPDSSVMWNNNIDSRLNHTPGESARFRTFLGT